MQTLRDLQPAIDALIEAGVPQDTAIQMAEGMMDRQVHKNVAYKRGRRHGRCPFLVQNYGFERFFLSSSVAHLM